MSKESVDLLTIAILAKDKQTTLPLYLHCIYSQTYPKNKTNLYIRTNDNTDNTEYLLKEFIVKYGHEYNDIYYDDTSINEELKKYTAHEWNGFRFKILGDIREKSIQYAMENKTWYFVADCDNFIGPKTIENLMSNNLEVVAPLLYSSSYYSNYHAAIDECGYYRDTDLYLKLYDRQIIGMVELPVIHCTYLIRPDILQQISYIDNTGRHEYVVFSDVLRKKAIPQYINNTDRYYGYIVFWENEEEKNKEKNEKLSNFMNTCYPNFIL